MEYVFGVVVTIAVCVIPAYLVRQWDNSRWANTTYVKPKVPPCPEQEGKHINVKFPDGLEGNVHVDHYSTNIGQYFYDKVEWTPPMKELFLLITQDYNNWKVVRMLGGGDCWKHKNLKVSIAETDGMYYDMPSVAKYSCDLSISDSQTSCVVGYAKCWREVKYGAKIDRIARIKACRYNRIRLESAMKEAKMITDYLENK